MSNSNRRHFLRSTALVAAGLAVANEKETPVAAQETEREVTLRERLLQCLGGPWPKSGELRAETVKTQQRDGYRLEWLSYEAEPHDRVSAILIVPDGVSASSPAPAIAVWHQHNGQWHRGKSEPAGLAGRRMHHTGVALAKEGYVVLCPDALCFEDRQDPDGTLKGGQYERFQFLRYLVAGKCLAWKNILDMRRAIDLLVSRPEVIADKLGCYGHSMGSTHTWLVGPWEDRLRCLVGNCCLPTYAAIERAKLLHCFPNFVPGFQQYGDTPDIAGLIAPRRLHLNFGERDAGSPIEEVRAGVDVIRAAYQTAGAEQKFSYFIQDVGHVLSDEMWNKTKATFAAELL